MNMVEDLSERIVYMLEGNIIFDGTLEELKTSQNESIIEKAFANLTRQHNVENIKV